MTQPPNRTPTAVCALALLLALAAAPLRAQEPEDSRPTWFAQALARGAAGVNVTYFWSLGPKLRTETVVAGHKVITIVSGDTYYAYDALGMSGVAIQRAPAAIAQDEPDRRPFGNELEMMKLQGGEKIREEPLMGTDCAVYQVSDEQGRRVLWVTNDDIGLPIRIEIYDRVRATTKYTDFIDWSRGLPITDAFFVPDPAVKFERFTLEQYVKKTAEEGPVGAVPVLYADLLHGRRKAEE